MQPDSTLQDNSTQNKAEQTEALSASLPASWALTPASPGPHSCQEPSLLSTYSRMGSNISRKGGASSQARRNNLTFLNRLFDFISTGSSNLLHPGPHSRSDTSASYTVGERERGGWAGVGGRSGAWEILHNGLPSEFSPVMQEALQGDREGVWFWLVCLIHHRARGKRNIQQHPRRA